uniref:Uncharacterized protein n=1 Tax=Panagrolaimus superbus TaxID=310955 RepID=A0A914YFA5_9BILA
MTSTRSTNSSSQPNAGNALYQIISGIFTLILAIFNAIRKALGFRNAQDDIDDFMYKPSPNFISAAPADPNYQTLAALDNDSVFGRDRLQEAMKRRKQETNSGRT